MKQIKFIYFDVGNVLNEYAASFDETTKKFSIDPAKFMDFWMEHEDDMTRGKMTADELWKKAIKRFQLLNAESHDFADSWVGSCTPQKKIHKIISKLKKINKYKIGLLTNHYLGMVEKSIEKGKIPNHDYHAIISSCSTGYQKPEKEIYMIATEKARVKAEEILFIDDLEENIEGAKKHGWQTVWFDMKNKDKAISEIEKILGV